jgi:hypothetical protein
VTSALLPTSYTSAESERIGVRGGSAGQTLELTQVAWAPSADIDLAEWSALGRRFGEIGRCSQWWLGDWIRYGNERFGERYTRAVKLTGYDSQSLMNMVYVASRFEISRRRENLSWSHHSALASLDADSQEHWLNRAIADKLSVADLRVELRGMRKALKAVQESAESSAATSPEGDLVCPTCGAKVPVSH